MIEAVSQVLSSVISQAVLAYFRRRMPFIPQEPLRPGEREKLAAEFKKWRPVTMATVLLVLFVLPVPCAFSLHAVYTLIYRLIYTAPDVFFPIDWPIFMVPGLLLALAVMGPLSMQLNALLLGKRYARMALYNNLKDGYDHRRAFAFVSSIFFYPFGMTMLIVSSAALVTKPAAFLYRPVPGLHTYVHAYKDIKGITYYRYFYDSRRQLQPLGTYHIFFAAGQSFNPVWYLGSGDTAFIGQLLRHNAPAIDTVQLLPD